MSGVSAGRARAKTELVARWRADTADYVAALDVSRDGELCAVGLGDGHVLVLDVGSGRERCRFTAHAGGVLGVSLAPGGRRVATCGQDPSAKVWSLDGQLLRELPGGSSAWVEHVAWAPAGTRLATAAGRSVRVWSSDGDAIVESEPLASSATALAWRSDGSGLAVSCYGGVHLMPFVAGAKARHLRWQGSLVSLAWSPDGKIIACGSQDRSVHLWRLASGRDSEMTGYRFKPKALAWDRESKLLATGGDANITVWDFRGKGPEGTRPVELDEHRGLCTHLAFSPAGGLLASGSQDTSILLWEPRKNQRPQRFAFLEDAVTALAWQPARTTLIGADAAGTVCAWDVA